MVDIAIPALTEISSAEVGDDIIIETAAGTRGISRENVQLRHAELTALQPAGINVGNDLIWLSDATDGLLKAVTVFSALFGNFKTYS